MIYQNNVRFLFVFVTAILLGCLVIGCDDSDSDSDKKTDAEITWYMDADGDGYGDLSSPLSQMAQPEGYVGNSDDCADYDADIYPGADEQCDGKDNNCSGAADENACESESQKISGRIINLNDAEAYITEASFLQLVMFPDDGQMVFTTDDQGRRTYISDLADTGMPEDDSFVFETYGLIPGQYVIAAQCLKPYRPGCEEVPVLAITGNQPAIIIVPEEGGMPFEVDLGNLAIPVPPPVTDIQTGPETPNGVSATDGTFEDKIRVTWNASSGATSYLVYRADSFDGQQVQVATTTNTSYDDTSVPCGVDYYYWIKARNAVGFSDLFYSDLGFIRCPLIPEIPDEDPGTDPDDSGAAPQDPAETPIILDAPSGVLASDGTFAGKVHIQWTASPGAASYDIYRCLTCCGTKTWIGSSVTTAYDDTEVFQRSFFYWIKAKNTSGTSEYSFPDTGYAMRIPPVPTGVRASDGVYLNRVLVSWNKSPGAASYEIYRARWSGDAKTMIGTTSNTSYYDSDLECSSCCVDTHVYWVKAVNAAGTSDFSDNDTGYVYRTLWDPTGINSSDGGQVACVIIRWNTVSGARWYDIYRSDAPDGEKIKVGTTEHPCNLYRDSTVTCPNVYYYWVKTIDRKGYTSCKFLNYDTGYCGIE